MTAFNIDLITEQPDRIFVEVQRRFSVTIIRAETGLELLVYPRTDGSLWDDPIERLSVDETEIAALEQQLLLND